MIMEATYPLKVTATMSYTTSENGTWEGNISRSMGCLLTSALDPRVPQPINQYKLAHILKWPFSPAELAAEECMFQSVEI